MAASSTVEGDFANPEKLLVALGARVTGKSIGSGAAEAGTAGPTLSWSLETTWMVSGWMKIDMTEPNTGWVVSKGPLGLSVIRLADTLDLRLQISLAADLPVKSMGAESLVTESDYHVALICVGDEKLVLYLNGMAECAMSCKFWTPEQRALVTMADFHLGAIPEEYHPASHATATAEFSPPATGGFPGQLRGWEVHDSPGAFKALSASAIGLLGVSGGTEPPLGVSPVWGNALKLPEPMEDASASEGVARADSSHSHGRPSRAGPPVPPRPSRGSARPSRGSARPSRGSARPSRGSALEPSRIAGRSPRINVGSLMDEIRTGICFTTSRAYVSRPAPSSMAYVERPTPSVRPSAVLPVRPARGPVARGSARPSRGSARPSRGNARPSRGSARPSRGSARPSRGSALVRPSRPSPPPPRPAHHAISPGAGRASLMDEIRASRERVLATLARSLA